MYILVNHQIVLWTSIFCLENKLKVVIQWRYKQELMHLFVPVSTCTSYCRSYLYTEFVYKKYSKMQCFKILFLTNVHCTGGVIFLLSLLDILLGIPWKSSGISRYFIRNKQRTMTFAVTIMLKKYDYKCVTYLKHTLYSLNSLLKVDNAFSNSQFVS